MKIRAWIVAAAIAAASGFATAPTAQACVINPDGECLTSVVRNTSHNQATHKKHHLSTRQAEVKLLPWQGPGGQGGPEGTQQPPGTTRRRISTTRISTATSSARSSSRRRTRQPSSAVEPTQRPRRLRRGRCPVSRDRVAM